MTDLDGSGGKKAGNGGGGKRECKHNCWFATLNSPSLEELTDVWKFNKADGGPVPDHFELGYSIIA